MTRGLRPTIILLTGLCSGAGVSAALGLALPEVGGLSAGMPQFLALGLCGLWALAALPYLVRFAPLLLVPALGLLPGGGWVALAGWTVVSWIALVALQRNYSAVTPQQLRDLRAELRDAEHERTLLHRHIQRYPTLMEACLAKLTDILTRQMQKLHFYSI